MSYFGGGTLTGPLVFNGTSAPSLSATDQGKIYYDSAADAFYSSVNGGAYAVFGGSSSLSAVLAIGNTTGANNIIVTAGQSIVGTDAATGGAFPLRAGNGSAGAGGLISLTGGASAGVGNAAGGVTITGGTPVDGAGGALSISGSAGVGTNRAGGNATLAAGDATGSGTGGVVQITSGGSPSGTPGVIRFSTASTGAAAERANINSAGTLLIGDGTATTSLTTPLSPYVILGYRNSASYIANYAFSATAADTSVYDHVRGRGTANTPAIVSNGDTLGAVRFVGFESSAAGDVAVLLEAFVDGGPAIGSMPGRFVLSTTASSTTTPVERLRVNQAGVLFLGNGETAASPNAGILSGTGGSGATNGAAITVRGGAGGGTSGVGGLLTLNGGAATAGASAGGATTVTTGAGSTSGNSGVLTLSTGVAGATGAGGAITVLSGSGGATSGNSGAVTIRTGTVTSGTVGTVGLGVGNVDNWLITATGNLEKQVQGDFILTERSVTPRTADLGLAHTNSFGVFTNEGAGGTVVFTLPAAAAGMEFEFYVVAAQTLNVTAGAGDTIRLGANVSAAAGNITNATIGGYVKLQALNATEWFASAPVGTWTVT